MAPEETGESFENVANKKGQSDSQRIFVCSILQEGGTGRRGSLCRLVPRREGKKISQQQGR